MIIPPFEEIKSDVVHLVKKEYEKNLFFIINCLKVKWFYEPRPGIMDRDIEFEFLSKASP